VPKRSAFLAMAVIGAVVPYLFFTEFFSGEGLNLGAFVSALFVNGAAGGFSADLLITSFVFWLWSYHDAHQLDIPNWWLIPVINLLVGLSAALPFYLYLRYDKASQTLAGASH
jgi:hypothetical protein